MTAYHKGRAAATHNEPRTPPYDKSEDDGSALSPYSAWLRGFDDKAADKQAKKEAAALKRSETARKRYDNAKKELAK